MTAQVDHAELKRLADDATLPFMSPGLAIYRQEAFRKAANPDVVLELLSEIEVLKARIKCLEKLGGEQSLRVMEQATRAKDAENALAGLSTQAPDNWRPTRDQIVDVLWERDPENYDEAGYGNAADAILALRPQTAESGK